MSCVTIFIENPTDRGFYIIAILIIFGIVWLKLKLDKIANGIDSKGFKCRILMEVKANKKSIENKANLIAANMPGHAICDGITLAFPPYVGLNIEKDASPKPAMDDWENAYSKTFYSGKIEKVVWHDDSKTFECYVEPYFCDEEQTTQEGVGIFEKEGGWIDFSRKREYWYKD